jgi:pimeloyl-ACP methyl ester carboxylesterase
MKSQFHITRARRDLQWWIKRIAATGVVVVLLLGALIWFAGRSAKATLVEQHPLPGRLVDVGGYRLHLNCMGQGSPTVILDAGLGSFSIVWKLVQAEVAGTTQVCAYDRAGYGWSELSPHPRTSEIIVEELHRLLEAAGVEKPYLLVGHSFGGMNARLYAHHFPEEVMGVVLVDSMHEEQLNRLPAYQKANVQLVGQFRWLAWLRQVGIVALLPEQIPQQGLPDEVFAQYAAILATSSYFETDSAERQLLETSLAEYRSANIHTLGTIPLVVISRGIGEPMPDLSEAENQQNEELWRQMQVELVALSSNSRHVIAAQSGHNIPIQQPELVSTAIQQMVQASHN